MRKWLYIYNVFEVLGKLFYEIKGKGKVVFYFFGIVGNVL